MSPRSTTVGPLDVVHLTTVHAATDVRILHKECSTLAAAGWRVALLAPGEQSHRFNDVAVLALGPPLRRWPRMTWGAQRIFEAALSLNARVYHFHDPELMPVGVALKYHGKRVIYDVHEDLPAQVLTKHWIRPWARPAISRSVHMLEQFAARHFDGVVTATSTIAARFPSDRTIVVNNYPLQSEIESLTAASRNGSRTSVGYIGGLGRIRGTKELIEALGKLPSTVVCKLIVAGRFASPAMEAEVTVMPGWHQVDFRGWCSRAEVLELLGEISIGMVTLLPTPNHLNSNPVKLFEYMAAGIPVIASDFPKWRNVIAGHQCGLLVDASQPAEIARALQWLLERPQEAAQMGKRGRQAVQEHFNWNREANKLTEFYERIFREDRNHCGRATPIREGSDCQSRVRTAA